MFRKPSMQIVGEANVEHVTLERTESIATGNLRNKLTVLQAEFEASLNRRNELIDFHS